MSCRLAFSVPWEETFLCPGLEGSHLSLVQIPHIWQFLPSSVLPQVRRRVCLCNAVQQREKSPGQALSSTQLFSTQPWGCILQAGTQGLLRCPETSVQAVRLTGTQWDGKQRESRTGGTGKWLKWSISESWVHQLFTTGVLMQVWQNCPASTGALIFLHLSLVSIMGSTETSLFIAYCQVISAPAMQSKKPHCSSSSIFQSWRQQKQGDTWENNEVQ